MTRLRSLGAYCQPSLFLGVRRAAQTTVTGGTGNDRVRSSYSFIVGAWQFHGGTGNDTIDVRTSASNGAVVVNGDAGTDAD